MNQIVGGVLIGLGALLAVSGITRADDDETDKELKRLEGVWASTPAKKGRDRGYILVFQGGRMGWRSFQTQDGEAVIGHSKLYEITLEPKASPKHITATLGEGDDRETRRGIYEVDGNTLKIAFGSGLDGDRPTKFEDEKVQVITLARDKKAKVPDLTKAGKRGKETRIEPREKWLGQMRDVEVRTRLPQNPITTRTEFDKVWKELRGATESPKVDFANEFVLVQTSASGKVTAIGLIVYEGDEKVADSVSIEVKSGEKCEGFTYAIGVFRRDRVDVVDGHVVAKEHQKP